jgi:hypothetical protein
MELTLWAFFGHASFALTAVSFYVKDILVLRAFSISAGAVGILYYYLFPSGPRWLVIFWLCVFMAINAFRIAHLMYETKKVKFSDEERELFETLFRNFAPVEFMKLLRIGEWRAAGQGDVLATEGEEVTDLTLIYNGEVVIEKNGAEVARSRDGTLVGEMSFLQGGAATATVRAARDTRLLIWPKQELQKLLKRNPTMDIAMNSVFTSDLTRKLGGAPA